MKQAMTPQHPKWSKFVTVLNGPDYCDFRERIEGDPRSITWKCAGGRDKTFATKILSGMKGIDVEKSLDYFDAHGGHCDCEILFNVDEG